MGLIKQPKRINPEKKRKPVKMRLPVFIVNTVHSISYCRGQTKTYVIEKWLKEALETDCPIPGERNKQYLFANYIIQVYKEKGKLNPKCEKHLESFRFDPEIIEGISKVAEEENVKFVQAVIAIIIYNNKDCSDRLRWFGEPEVIEQLQDLPKYQLDRLEKEWNEAKDILDL
ncbi:MAG: hypothetical protein OEZ36_07625 [Spirochaetota bacterium]|nr:hypothetical protein [Spirochaetota bacterium]